LEVLELSFSGMDDKGIDRLCAGLACREKLQKLLLEFGGQKSRIGKSMLIELCQAVESCKNLK